MSFWKRKPDDTLDEGGPSTSSRYTDRNKKPDDYDDKDNPFSETKAGENNANQGHDNQDRDRSDWRRMSNSSLDSDQRVFLVRVVASVAVQWICMSVIVIVFWYRYEARSSVPCARRSHLQRMHKLRCSLWLTNSTMQFNQ